MPRCFLVQAICVWRFACFCTPCVRMPRLFGAERHCAKKTDAARLRCTLQQRAKRRSVKAQPSQSLKSLSSTSTLLNCEGLGLVWAVARQQKPIQHLLAYRAMQHYSSTHGGKPKGQRINETREACADSIILRLCSKILKHVR